ncbi:unnamed protein product [Clonostachys chloroleuca]|uniref:Uncharacterized protein n=1 Tax=Clonostachys chloroleuca TaxID=1926264 RepID=A0AA35QFH7_9HYPO|nr:unnamed protein product [Clonostachys chloroleuca]
MSHKSEFRDMTCLLGSVIQKAKENPMLDGVLESRVKRLHIEFSDSENQTKPHVVLRLILNEGVLALQEKGRWKSAGSCMFDSNNRQQVEGAESGVVFRVHELFKGQTWQMHKDSTIAFIYDVDPVHTVKEYVNVILGKHKGLPDGEKSNLSWFVLTSVDEHTLDGCRDAVTQWVIRLHRMGFMNWIADRAMLDDKEQTLRFPQEFDAFIARRFKNLRTGLKKLKTTPKVEMTGDYIPMRFGHFQDTAVARIIQYGEIMLPYNYPAATRKDRRDDCIIVPSPSTPME